MRSGWLPAMLLALPAAAQAPLVLEGEVPEGGPDFVLLPFEVPAGTTEVEVRHQSLTPDNILDFGVHDPARYRGWGGGNTEPAVIGAQATSRSYLTGALPAGTWSVVMGKAKLVTPPARYRVEVLLRAAPTLTPQPERDVYAGGATLEKGARWYAGDFHVHSKESGDARPPLDEIATFARSRGLDFVELSDHNTNAQVDFIDEAQGRHPKLLFLPGVEFTTYQGHANGIGATRYVDHRLGLGDATMASAARQFVEQGAALSLNHPMLDMGANCIGCAWKQPIPSEQLSAVEIGTGAWDKTGVLFGAQTLAFWDRLLALGLHVAPLGGSDDHRAGVDLSSFQSPIGSPTTLVWAEELSAAAIVEAVRRGRTVVKLWGPEDPMVELSLGDARIGDTAHLAQGTLQVTVTGGQGAQLRLVHNGVALDPVAITQSPFDFAHEVAAPAEGAEDRWRAEVWLAGQPRTVTGHVWLAPPHAEPSRCGCAGAPWSTGLVALLAALRQRRAECRRAPPPG